MKVIGSILRSYFHRRMMVLWMMVPAACLLIIANILIPSHPKAAWCFFLYALTFAAGMTGFQLRQALESDTGDMLPNHRIFQLATAGIILAVLLIWPVVLTVLKSGPLLPTLAIYLFFACLGMGAFFFTTRAGGLSLILGIPAISWLLYDIYRLAGLSPEVSRIAGLKYYASPFWPIYVTAASVLGLILFANFYLRMPYASFSDEVKADHVQCLLTQDWIGPLAVGRASKAIARLSRAPRHGPSSLFRTARLFQFGLFSPVYSVKFYGFGIFLFCLLYTYLSFHQKLKFDAPAMNFYLPFAYFIFTAVLAADFLSHRDRLPSLYIQSDLPTRSAFVWATVLSYLLVVTKQVLGVTLVTIVIHLVFPWTTWTNFVPLCAIGLFSSLVQVSLSLLAGKWMKSVNGLAWLVGNALMALLIVPLSRLYSGSSAALVAIAALSGFLFWLAFHKWSGVELDFAAN